VRANIDVSHLVLSDTSPLDLKKLGKQSHPRTHQRFDGKSTAIFRPDAAFVKFEPYFKRSKS